MTVFGLRLVAALMLIPAWQQPDEPSHMATVRILKTGGSLAFPRTPTDDVEGLIIPSMARHDWWRYYQRPTPDPLPTSFEQIQSAESAVVTGPLFYYRIAAAILRAVDLRTIESEVLMLRALSSMLAMMTAWSVWRGARLVVGGGEAVMPVALVTLHPQFMLNAVAVSPDMLVSLCGALVWWQGMALLTGSPIPSTTTLTVLSAAAGAAVRRVGIPLLGAAIVPLALRAWRSGLGASHRRLRLAGTIAVLAIGSLLVMLLAAGEFVRLTTEARMTLDRLIRSPPDTVTGQLEMAAAYALVDLDRALNSTVDWRFFRTFSRVLFDSAWLTAGWMRYPGHDGWLMTMHLFGIAGLVGAILPSARRGLPAGVLVASVLMFGVQVAAVYLMYFPRHIGPQGRYLFPMIGAAATVIWIGWRGWVPAHLRELQKMAWLAFLGIMDVLAWTTVLLPIYGSAGG